MKRRIALAVCGSLVGGALVAQSASGAENEWRTTVLAPIGTLRAVRWSPEFPPFIESGGFLIGSLGAGFEVRVTRPLGSQPTATLIIRRNNGDVEQRPLPASTKADLSGLINFATITVSQGSNVLLTTSAPTCLASGWYWGGGTRLDLKGPDRTRLPGDCGRNPFATGSLTGVESGWANPVGLPGIDLPDGDYTMKLTVNPAWAKLLRMSTTSAEAPLHVETYVDPGGANKLTSFAAASAARSTARRTSAPKPQRTFTPPAASVPDLIPLPAYGIASYPDFESGLDLLGFGANEWNAGPGQMVIEGFRRAPEGAEPVMDTHQVFYRDGAPVGSEQVGEMEFHSGGGHDHWHFRDFAEYSLTDANKSVVQTSGKQAWCLAPTDAIDMTIKNAVYRPETIGLGSSCGSSDARWIRETMPVGWGDTYSQFVSGQAFDISSIPNGTYYIKVEVNPAGRLVERSYANNVSYREIILGGEPGARTVTVPPYMGIDTEVRGGAGALRSLIQSSR